MVLPDDPGTERRVGARDLATWRSAPGRRLAGLALRWAGRWGRWGAANVVLLATVVTGLVVTVLLASAAEEVYDDVVDRDGLAGLDQPVLDAAVRLRSPGLDRAVTAYTDLAGPVGMTVLAVLAVVAMTVAWRTRTPMVLMAVAAAGSLTLTTLGKDLVGRVRPPQGLAVPPFESSPSFPSGHTLNATVVAGVAAYLLLPRLARAAARVAAVAGAALFAGTIGLSRVFLGHHWLSDVVMGWVLGLAWLTVVVTAHRLHLTVRTAGRPQATPSADEPGQCEAAGRSTTQWSPSSRNPSRS